MSTGTDFFIEEGVLKKCRAANSSVIIPDGVTDIAAYAFVLCSNLESVTIPCSVTRISSAAFYDCRSLTRVNITDIVKWCGLKHYSMSFSSPFDLYLNETLVTDLVIPDEVKVISSFAFAGCRSLFSVSMPAGLAGISDGTFQGCSALQTIEIPDSVTSIGQYAFSGCGSLTSVKIPDGVTRIEDAAFARCSSLQTMVIPESVTSIGASAFSGCTSLQNAVIPGGVSIVDCGVFSGCSSLKTVTIPDRVVSIKGDAFKGCSNLSDVSIPDGVTSIGRGAFRGCETLLHISVPDSVTDIGNSAFSGCSSLERVSVPDNVSVINEDVFSNCKSLSGIRIPDGVTEICADAFRNCSSLSEITIPDSVTVIRENAFENCKKMKRAVIPDSVKEIGRKAFGGCSGLRSVVCPENCESAFTCCGIESAYLFDDSEPDGFLKSMVSKKLKAKWKACFDEIIQKDSGSAMARFLGAWKTVSLENLDYFITKATTHNCAEVIAVLLDYRNKHYSEEKVETHKEKQTEKEIGLREKTYHDWQKEFRFSESPLESGALVIKEYRGKEASVLIPGQIGTHPVAEIEAGAFSGCKTLTSVLIPDSVREIGDYAFSQCIHLGSVILPDRLRRLGARCFSGCRSLRELRFSGRELNAGIASIGAWAFLETDLWKDKNNWEDNVLYIADHLIEAGSSVAGSYTIRPGTKCIADRAFFGCSSLADIVIPDGLLGIGAFAFSNCTSLTALVLPDSIDSIGKAAFEKCFKLRYFNISESQLPFLNASVVSRTEAAVVVRTSSRMKLLAYAAKADCDNLQDYVRSGDWLSYDLELINNGPRYYYRIPTRLFGALGRLMDPVDLTEENRKLFEAFLRKNTGRALKLAQALHCPEMISALYDCGFISSEQQRSSMKQLMASAESSVALLTTMSDAMYNKNESDTIDEDASTRSEIDLERGKAL